ncbi:polyketide cyclase [Caulobacter sp. SLTY]|uniref:SRPBCC family protein n=1 Tax=Caulobacter sp. SLTY TaxID=2683262 RepID=UPI0014132E7D|nr:SRPBCC family protein [Caulobacter sp. SLTY]NBB16705.1 polyketide cyclase [Caulobacter sp. SLTY]
MVEVKAQTMIRAPADKVFEAFVDPEVTTRFWFSKASGRLESGAVVRWEWEMYGAADDIHVRSLEPGKSLVFDWGGEDGLTRVECTLTELGDGQTFVEVTNIGFKGDADSVIAQALDSNGGFTTVLCAAKVWLEHGINARLIEDKYPQALSADWKGR